MVERFVLSGFRGAQGSSRTGTQGIRGNIVPVLFYTTGTSFPLFFFLYTPIVNCNFPWKSVLESNFSEKKLNLLK